MSVEFFEFSAPGWETQITGPNFDTVYCGLDIESREQVSTVATACCERWGPGGLFRVDPDDPERLEWVPIEVLKRHFS